MAVCGDIRDQALLRFIWRDMKREDSPEVFEWQVLPFATACSPCCATFSLQMHARDHRGPKEGVRHSVEHCFYVNTPDEAKELVDRLRQMLTSGGFEIRQWACNIPNILRHLPAEARSDSLERWLSQEEPGLLEPAFGLSWL